MMRGTIHVLPCVLLAACAVAGSDSGTTEQALNQPAKANISLTHSQASLLQTSDTPWSLAKTGVVDTSAKTVTWTVTATPGTTVGGHLVVDGFLGLTNFGTGPATIGNIVVNLQTRVNGHWVTQSSDVADATNGDAATTAHVVANATSEHHAVYSESPASGALSFMDRKTNTVWSLVPEVSVPAHTSVQLLFSAAFDNTVLHLANQTHARFEILVTFGNHPAGNGANTAANVDINGNGVIDADEAKVRTVATLIDKVVPATQAANGTVTLADSVADIRTEGTVTFTNPIINLGATTGTVQVTYDAGTTGGSITNCATATGVGVTDPVGQYTFVVTSPVSLSACDTETIQQTACVQGQPGCGWHEGDMVTYTQSNWGDVPDGTNIATVLDTYYGEVYSPFGIFQVGTAAGYLMTFGTSTTLMAYLPSGDVPGPLDSDLLDPMSSSSGAFGGDVAALKLNIDFADVGLVRGTAGLMFGNLRVCGLAATPDLNNLTVRQVLAALNDALGGLPTSDPFSDLDEVARQLDGAFFNGSPSTFAQDHLVDGACP
jgi:hypothetical protein